MLFLFPGDRGPKGEKGDRGGSTGKRSVAVVSPVLRAWFRWCLEGLGAYGGNKCLLQSGHESSGHCCDEAAKPRAWVSLPEQGGASREVGEMSAVCKDRGCSRKVVVMLRQSQAGEASCSAAPGSLGVTRPRPGSWGWTEDA